MNILRDARNEGLTNGTHDVSFRGIGSSAHPVRYQISAEGGTATVGTVSFSAVPHQQTKAISLGASFNIASPSLPLLVDGLFSKFAVTVSGADGTVAVVVTGFDPNDQ